MPTINEIKEQQTVVTSVGNFADSLQQIAAARMVKLRKQVMAARRFVDESVLILRELQLEKQKQINQEIDSTGSKKNMNPDSDRSAIIVVSSDQGLCGSYNSEIFKKIEFLGPRNKDADWFVLGKKGQEFFKKFSVRSGIKYYPFSIPEEVSINDLKPLIGMFYYYKQIHLIYSKYINTATREVVFLELVVPNIEEVEVRKEVEEGKFIFEPNIDILISSITARLRYALFRQQILDSKLSLYTAQMMAMKTAADNAVDLLKELKMEYNKARRKLIDKKIQEVQAGRALWAD